MWTFIELTTGADYDERRRLIVRLKAPHQILFRPIGVRRQSLVGRLFGSERRPNMTTEQTSAAMTEVEVQAFAAKIQAWWEQLTPSEQALLRAAIHAVGAEGEDVQGYGDVMSTLSQLFGFGNVLPPPSVVMNLIQPRPTTTAPSGTGGSGGSFGSRTAMN